MPTYRLTLEYDGRGFSGWQLQPGGTRTVQGELGAALQRVTGEAVAVVGAGRTDAGVHAEGQVASLVLSRDLEPDRLRGALNGVLPGDVAVVECRRAPEGFHARRDARAKRYRYRIWNGASRSPLRADRAWWLPQALDADAMRAAAAALVGSHDFASFQAAGSAVRTTRRRLTGLDVLGEGRGEIELWAVGEGFLRHMVRILAGTLVEVGLGRRRAEGLAALLAARDRRLAGPTAPARGLTLVRVDYDAPAGRGVRPRSGEDSA